MFKKANGSALPEAQIKQMKEDQDTFDKISILFDKMRRRSKYVQDQDGHKINSSLKVSPRNETASATEVDLEDFANFRSSVKKESNFMVAPRVK